MSFTFAESPTIFTCFYPVFSPKEEESGQETGKKKIVVCLLLLRGHYKSALVSQSPGKGVAAHCKCGNRHLERGTKGRKQDLTNSLKIMTLNSVWVIFVSTVYLKALELIHIRWHEKDDKDVTIPFSPD